MQLSLLRVIGKTDRKNGSGVVDAGTTPDPFKIPFKIPALGGSRAITSLAARGTVEFSSQSCPVCRIPIRTA
jgi:hypothetical protein